MSKELIDEVNKKLPEEAQTTLEQKAIYIMDNKMPISSDIGLISGFSGCDIVGFFDGEMPDIMEISMTKKTMVARFLLGPLSTKIALDYDRIDFHLVGINETGHTGIISGTCKPIDFNIAMSIDELNIEIIIDFESKITNIEGWMGVDNKTNESIRQKFHELRMEYYKRKGLIQ